MSDIHTNAGITFSVALGDPDLTIAGFESLTYTEVGEVGSIPEFGGKAAVKTFVPLGQRAATKYPGAFNYGATAITLASVEDAGQQALRNGFDGTNEAQMHSFRMAHPDIGSIYFAGVIGAYRYLTGDANTIRRLTVEIHLVGKPLVGEFVELTDSAGNTLTIANGDSLVIWR